MVSEKSAYIVNFFSQGIGRVATTAVNFLIFILLARHLGTEIFGKFSYIVSFWALLIVFAEFGTQTVLAKDIAQVDKERAPVYLGNYFFLRGALCLVAAVFGGLVAALVRPGLLVYILGGCLLLPFLSWRFYDPVFQVYQKPWYAALTSLIFSVVYVALMTAAIFWPKNLEAVIAAYLAANVIYTVLLMKCAFSLVKPRMKLDAGIIRGMLKLSVPIGIASVYTIINSKADIFMLAYLKSDEVVGLYNAAYRFLDLLAVLVATMTMPLIPLFACWFAGDRAVLKQRYARIMELITVVTLPAAIMVPFISREVMVGCFGEAFAPAAGALNILAWVGVLVFYSLVSSIVNFVAEDIRHSYWNGAVAASLNICLNALWIPQYGFIGSSWATLISEIALLGVCLYHVFKNIGNFIDFKTWGKIMAVNAVFFILLKNFTPHSKSVLTFAAVIGFYVAVIFAWRIMPWQTIKDFLPAHLRKEMMARE